MTKKRSPENFLRVRLRAGHDGYIVAECPDIPGCMSQGQTREEALANIRDAISACLLVMIEDLLKVQSRAKRRTAVSDEEVQMFRVAPPTLERVEA
ncbi:MAG: type II toxin-antitoxin system HicB family antitoxin [Terriglobales bacterium]